MSDEFLSEEETEHLDPNIRAELRKSRERAKAAEQAQAELDALKRDLAFTKAGIPDTGTGALLRKAYDGDTDPEAIRKAAEEYGIFGEAPQAQAPNPIHEELEQHRAIAGATGTNNSGPDNSQSFLAAVQSASNVEEVMAAIRTMGGESGVFATGMQ